MNVSCAAPRRLALFPALIAIALVAGCESKDETPGSVDPGGGTEPSQQEAIQGQVLLAFDTSNGIAAGVDEAAQGDFSEVVAGLALPGTPARAAEDFVWDPAQGAWVLAAEGTESDATSTATYSISGWIQFVDGTGTPQYEPDGTTAAMTIDVGFDLSLEAHEDGQTFAMDLAYDSYCAVSGLPAGPYAVLGNGAMSGSILWTGPDIDNFDVTFDMSYDMDVVVPPNDGCPTGTMSVSIEQYDATATYDGSPVYSWQMRENGTLVASGQETLACNGTPAGAFTPWDRVRAMVPF